MRMLRKETIAKNIINSTAITRKIELIPNILWEGCENIDKEITELNLRKKTLLQLRQEFLRNNVKFVRKYAKPKKPYHSKPINDFLKKEHQWKELAKRLDKKSNRR